jgi:hypothetical protein
MAKKRYRAIGTGLVDHPTIKTYVGYRRVLGGDAQERDVVVPGGHRWRWMPDGDLVEDNAMLRAAARDGHLEELPLELPDPKASTAKRAPKHGAEGEV